MNNTRNKKIEEKKRERCWKTTKAASKAANLVQKRHSGAMIVWSWQKEAAMGREVVQLRVGVRLLMKFCEYLSEQ